MADPFLAHPANAAGDFYVDTKCIGCTMCRQFVPAVFGAVGEQVVVKKQPAGDEILRSLMGLVSCPVNAIGTRAPADLKAATEALPEPIAENVFCCGFASADAGGAQSYFIRRKQGNILIDSPRFTDHMVAKLEQLGGVQHMVITHADNAADHELFQRHFNCERIIHKSEAKGVLALLEKQLTGDGPWSLAPGFRILFTPGHAAGHISLLSHEIFLFTGDHLFWNPEIGGLDASRRLNGWNWGAQLKSIERLIPEQFTWVLPSHGYRVNAKREEMSKLVAAALERLKQLT